MIDFDSIPEVSLHSKIEKNTIAGLMKRYQWPILIGFLVASDLAMTFLAFRTAYQIRFEFAIPLFQLDVVPSEVFYQSLYRFLIPLWVIIFAAIGLYSSQNLLGGTQEYSLTFNATSLGMFSVMAFGFLQPDFMLARGWLLLSWMLAFFFTAAARFIIRRAVYAARQRGYFLTPAIIVGANAESLVLAEQLVAWKRSGLDLVGFVDNQAPVGKKLFRHLSSLGTVANLHAIIRQHEVKEVIVTTSAFTRDDLLSIFKQHGLSDKVNLSLSSGLYEVITTGLQVKEMASVPLVSVNKVRLTGMDLVLKLLLDYLLGVAALLVAVPIFAVIAIAVRLDSPGPIFHRRRVMGVNGRKFDAFKFRTMHTNGDEILAQHPELLKELEANHKLRVDPRVTRVGAILRKFSLDELPQIVNVLRGEMSIVGPRMISPEEMKMYNQWGINLLTVKPGITGLWQVSGRSDVSYEERVRMDMQYVRNWSIWLDIKLLIETIPAVLSKRGAY